jgi:hypothetical protein
VVPFWYHWFIKNKDMLKKIQEWLDNPKRDYHQGKEFFQKYASESAKEKFSNFFNQVDTDVNPEQFDPHFTILVNQVSFVRLRLKNNPKAFVTGVINDIQKEKASKGSSHINQNSVTVRLDNLPKQFDKDRARLKELVPLMASIHADMGSEIATDEVRAESASILVKLDLERRSIWDRIENYIASEGKELAPEEKENEFSENDIVRGAQIAARIDRLKENIKNNENSVLKHKENGKEHLIPGAEQRIKKYQTELTELEALLNEK